jgi:hypothetical protein
MTNGMLFMSNYIKSNNEIVDQFNFFPADTVHDDAPDVVQMLNEVTKPTITESVRKQINNSKPNRKYGGSY